ncbi:hypothetical protein MRX96_002597 [Rhipicephalus microplus]
MTRYRERRAVNPLQSCRESPGHRIPMESRIAVGYDRAPPALFSKCCRGNSPFPRRSLGAFCFLYMDPRDSEIE